MTEVTVPLSDAPAKLRLLADWFDATRPAPDEDDEVQRDLRRWATLIECVIEALADAGVGQAPTLTQAEEVP